MYLDPFFKSVKSNYNILFSPRDKNVQCNSEKKVQQHHR